MLHGTFWSKEDEPHTELDEAFNDFGLVYVTQSMATARYFAAWHNPPSDAVLVILKGHVNLRNPFEVDAMVARRNGNCVEIEDTELDLRDRAACVSELSARGFDALVISGNYPDGGDDIGLFSGRDFVCDSASLKFPGEEWSEFLPKEEALSLFMERRGEDRGQSSE